MGTEKHGGSLKENPEPIFRYVQRLVSGSTSPRGRTKARGGCYEKHTWR